MLGSSFLYMVAVRLGTQLSQKLRADLCEAKNFVFDTEWISNI